MRLNGKVAIVRGGGSGSGRATCELFAEEGAEVFLSDIDATAGQETMGLIEDKGGRGKVHKSGHVTGV